MAATLALTFDDGPHPDGTRGVLALLERHGVTATFFVWGERAREHPEVVGEVLAAGHRVEPHCWEHVSHWRREPAAIAADLDAVMELLGELGVAPPTLWRPPYGHTLAGATREVAQARGLELAGWTINPHDYAGRDPAVMHAEVAAAAAAPEQTVVLLHDGHRESGQRRPDASNTVELVAMLLDDDALAFAPLAGALAAGLSDGPEADGGA